MTVGVLVSDFSTMPNPAKSIVVLGAQAFRRDAIAN
jgi:hypothetical protein